MITHSRSSVHTHMSVVVQDVVCEFEPVERDDAVHPMSAVGRRVAVHVDSAGHLRVSAARRQPLGGLEAVAVARLVDDDQVQHERVTRLDGQTGQSHLQHREHSPVKPHSQFSAVGFRYGCDDYRKLQKKNYLFIYLFLRNATFNIIIIIKTTCNAHIVNG